MKESEIKETNNYWIDSNNNKWIKNNYSKEVANSLSKTLKNCLNCLNCLNCSGCSNCSNCLNSSYCSGCLNCLNCLGCLNCLNSSYSSYCSNCSNCLDCSDCLGFKTNPQRIVSMNLGTRNKQTTFYWNEEKGQIVCGCYKGTIDEFKERIKKVHKNNKYAKGYFKWIKSVENYINSL